MLRDERQQDKPVRIGHRPTVGWVWHEKIAPRDEAIDHLSDHLRYGLQSGYGMPTPPVEGIMTLGTVFEFRCGRGRAFAFRTTTLLQQLTLLLPFLLRKKIRHAEAGKNVVIGGGGKPN